MSQNRDPESRNRVIPRLEPLEDRFLLSDIPFINSLPRTSGVAMQGGLLSDIPFINSLPRTGGVAMQVGSVLELGVASPLFPGVGVSSTLILQDGRGDVAVSWDSQPFHFFSGINNISLLANAPGNIAMLVSLPLTAPQQVAVQMTGVVNAFLGLVPPGGAPLNVQANPGVFTLVL
jgi:hypothetical protein